MTIRFHAAMALSLGLLLTGPAFAKTAHPIHHAARHAVHRNIDVRYAQGFYDYRAAATVREEFGDGPSSDWRHDDYFERRDFYRERQDGGVVENLSDNFTGGVGYGANGDVPGFVDGFGQTHFFVGNFRRMAPMGRFGARRFGGPRFGGAFSGGFHGGFR